ncbi:hypothetical protein E2C01_038062 [Portunus trituberculatus]|uniref:Uncharacterized protein n=1 Tax=Portunus trituberculatus TaxID=210409 RepID=A0A5B7FGL4_PORTR|nr:hypothetical protein [Portunus trituberculatus]
MDFAVILGCIDKLRCLLATSASHIALSLGDTPLGRAGGIKICTETGCIHIHKDKIKLEENIEVSRQLDLEGQDISLTWKSIFPFLNMPEGAYICYEKKCSLLT